MNPPKYNEEDYINLINATPRQVTVTKAERVQPVSRDAPAHDAFTRLLTRLEPDAETLWAEAETRRDENINALPYQRLNDLIATW